MSNAEASAGKKYKKQFEEAQAKCGEVEREKKKLEDKIKEAASAVDLIDVPVKTLTRLLASRFPEESKKGYKKDPESHLPKRTKDQIKSWFPVANLLLLLCLLGLCGYGCYALSKLPESTDVVQKAGLADVEETNDNGTTIDNTESSEDALADTGIDDNAETSNGVGNNNPGTVNAEPSYDEFSNCLISISPYNGESNLKKGNTYTLSVKKKDYTKASVPSGTWVATEGITINGNTFTVDASINQPTNVLIHYTVNKKHELNRTITVE